MRLPILRPRQVIKILTKAGFEDIRQTGSHRIMVNRDTKRIVTVPIHARDIKRGLLRSIIKQSGLNREKFL